MNKQEMVKEMNQMHVEHANSLSKLSKMLDSSGENGVLLWLRENGDEVFAVDIIEHFGLTPGRVANIVKKLQERGYIERHQNFQDMRKVHITLTESGRSHAEDLYNQLGTKHMQIVDALGEEDAEQIIRIMNKVISILENQ